MFFSHFRPRDSTTENYFHAHINAYLLKRQKANSLESITWSELGKQSIQAKKFNWGLKKVGGSSPPGPASKMLAKATVCKGGSWSCIPALFFTRIPHPELFSCAISNTFFFPNPYPCQILANPASRVAVKSRIPPYILVKSQAREYPSRHCKAAWVNTVQI